MKITPEELKVILEKHVLWLSGKEGGSRADLRDADLRDADLRDADLRYADLRDADLRDADLRDAVLRYADGLDENSRPKPLTDADYIEIRDRFRRSHPDVPVVPLLDSTICRIVNSGQGKLEMGNWHECETTHCRAGWAIHLAGEAGYALEEKYDPERAGGMIYRASTGRWPDFFAGNDAALEDICAWGAKEEAPGEASRAVNGGDSFAR